ncbi:hypothetical protein BLNAU_6864 [Blattamonas nauphoetae]|uniref:Uncharacterized protein n=1 Tax=Blattamonas nauphoetae TaxID=2049346 RepID=A0ABQ9Y364_9EUKA|nr:hypothetical protein BLNAU_6864 [Blattamonas nauphoetae]
MFFLFALLSASSFRTPNALGDAPTDVEVSEVKLQSSSASLTLTYDNTEDIPERDPTEMDPTEREAIGRKATCEGCLRDIAVGFTSIFVSSFVVISTLVLICCCCCYHHHKKESQTPTPAYPQIRPQTVYLPPPPQPGQPGAYYPPAPMYYPSAPQQQQVLMYPPPVAYAVPTQVPPPTAARPTYSTILINKE